MNILIKDLKNINLIFFNYNPQIFKKLLKMWHTYTQKGSETNKGKQFFF